MISLVVVAPGLALRLGLRSMLNTGEGLQVAGEATSLAELEELLSSTQPDTDVIVDAGSLLLETGSDGTLQSPVKWKEPYPALLLLTDQPPPLRELSRLPLRAWGVLPLDASGEELVAAVRALNEGLWVGAPHLLEALSKPTPELGRPLSVSGTLGAGEEPLPEALTARETEVLQQLAQGLANKQIARALSISEHTVKFHISSIYTKLGVANRAEAVRVGVRRGVILL